MGFRLIAGIVAFWVLVLYIPYSRFASHPPAQQAPSVNAEQKADSPIQTQGDANAPKDGRTQTLPSNPIVARGGSSEPCDSECQRRAEERSEFWVIFGHKTKITDFFLAVFTGLLFAVGTAQIVYLRLTVRDTGASAEAAHLSAVVAKDALELSQRAFVFVNFRNTASLDPGTGNVDHWTFTPVWTNAGDTPTRDMQNHISLMVRDTEIDSDWDFPNIWSATVPEGDRVPTPLQAAPRSSVDGEALSVSLAAMDDIVAGRRFLYFWGWAAYNDVFRNTPRHITRFAVRIVVGGNPRDPNRISFSYPYLRTYNCSDEECDRQGFPATWTAPVLEV